MINNCSIMWLNSYVWYPGSWLVFVLAIAQYILDAKPLANKRWFISDETAKHVLNIFSRKKLSLQFINSKWWLCSPCLSEYIIYYTDICENTGWRISIPREQPRVSAEIDTDNSHLRVTPSLCCEDLSLQEWKQVANAKQNMQKTKHHRYSA